jgi:hypothetical protein
VPSLSTVTGGLAGVGLPCPWRAATGLDCPFCGATRATFALLHGAFTTAVDHNALYVLSLPAVAIVGLLWLVRGGLPGWLRQARTAWALVALVVVWTVVRNLPWQPFAVLGSDLARQ